MEEWKDIKGYEGLYQVSNKGRIRRILFVNNIVRKPKIKILKLYTNKRNRQQVSLYKDDNRRVYSVHRLVATAFLDNDKNLPEVNHIDCNPSNNNLENLEWCSKSDNAKHAYRNDLNILREVNNKNKKHIIRSDGKIYDCAYSASVDMQVSVCSIRDVLKGRTKSCKGLNIAYI